jgi:hypothetical protein
MSRFIESLQQGYAVRFSRINFHNFQYYLSGNCCRLFAAEAGSVLVIQSAA